MPLDHSIVIEGGWRILSGQWFYSGFYTPAAQVPSLIQAVFFLAFGKTWLAIRLHSAVFNGLFCVIAYLLLRRNNLNRISAFMAAAASAVIFYAPSGLPFADQHSFFFLLLSVWMAWESVQRSKPLVWAWLSFAALAASWFSKPMPAMFALPVIPLILFILFRKDIQQLWKIFAGGFFICVLFILVFYNPLFGNPEWIRMYAFQFPSETGAARWQSLPGDAQHFFGLLHRQPFRILKAGDILCWRLSEGLYLFFLLSLIVKSIRPAAAEFLRFLPGLFLLFCCGLFTGLTQNQPENGIPFVFIYLGFLHKAWETGLERLAHVFTHSLSVGKGMRISLIAAFIGLYGYYALSFHASGVESLVVNDIYPSRFEWKEQEGLMKGMPRIVPKMCWQNHPRFVAEQIQKSPGSFFIFGDEHFLYPLLGQEAWGKALWYHPGLSMPQKGSREMEDFQRELIGEFESRQLKYFFLESREERTWMNLRMQDMPLLEAWLGAHTENLTYGREPDTKGWAVWEIRN